MPDVDLCRPYIVCSTELAGNIRTTERKFSRLPDNVHNPYQLFDRRSTLGKGQKLSSQVRGPFCCLKSPLQRHADVVGSSFQERYGQVTHDAGEKIVEIVGNTACQHTEGFKFMSPQQVLFHSPTLGNIINSDNGTGLV